MDIDNYSAVISAVKNSTVVSVVKTATNPVTLLSFLQANGYAIMFILMVIEGPIVTYVAAFAASLGIFNVYYVLIISFLGNIIGDIVVFYMGRFGRRYVIERYVSHWLKAKKIKKIRKYLKENPGKTIAVIKLTPGLPVPGVMLTGVSEIPFKTFLYYSSILCFGYSLTMTLLGFYSGIALGSLPKYIRGAEYVIIGVLLFAIIIYYLMKYVSKIIATKIEKL